LNNDHTQYSGNYKIVVYINTQIFQWFNFAAYFVITQVNNNGGTRTPDYDKQVIKGSISLSISLARISTRSLAPLIEAITIPTNIVRNEIIAIALIPVKMS
jgi:hypothetical protein